ncbi:lecithin retinol acyltransferase family protein [Aliiglaciecola litoralis]|uniref:lecithin retinol acyltransferase family protein n=1 Tax=Aliiglaciecola litoralis TaxID=582857 RepID=UPI0031D32693
MAVKSASVVHYPGELDHLVVPQDGAIVCCGIFGVFEHSGIWIDNNIIELRGNGLIRGISPVRFLQNRSGNTIHLLCDSNMKPLIDPQTVTRAVARLYEYSEYHVLRNNCHNFVWQCVSGNNALISSFYDLNQALSRHFACTLSWCKTTV